VEEADETVFWLEMLADAGLVSVIRLRQIVPEAKELVAIFSAAQLTVKRGFNRKS
jgi:hypothetical protein